MTEYLLSCGVCGAETRDLYLCSDHIDGLTDMLDQAPKCLAELRTTLARLDRLGDEQGGRSGKPTPPLPINPAAMDAMDQLARAVRQAFSGHGSARLMAGRPEAGRVYADLRRALTDGWRVTDRRPDQWPYGGCEQCGTAMYGPPDAARIVCRHCDRAHDAAVIKGRQWATVDNSLVRRTEAVQLIAARYGERRPETVRKAIDLWVHRGVLEDRGGWVRFGDVDQRWRKRIQMRQRKAELAGAA